MSELTYGYKNGFVLLESSVVNTLNNWCQLGQKKEAGGILVGYRRPPHVHVVACTIPYTLDKRKRYEFIRKDPRHMSMARKYWNDSNGQIYYLGDWHTHPVNIPRPSSVDLYEWSKLKKSKLGPDLLFVIVGLKRWYVQYDNKQIDLVAENVSDLLFE